MSALGTTDLTNRIPEMWAARMYAELRNKIAFLNFFSREYEGAIRTVGDTVKVQQLAAPTAEILTNDKAQFNTLPVTISNIDIVANKRAVAAVEITDLAMLQSLDFQEELQNSLVYAVRKKIEQDLIAALIPSASNPNHQTAPAAPSALAAVDLATMRTLLSTALVPTEQRALFLAPSYYGDLMVSSQVMSRDFTAGNNSNSGVLDSFMGFMIAEHDLLDSDVGFAAHPSALQLVIQKEMTIKISDLHSQQKFGALISADVVYGFKLADNKRLVKISG
jgi:hypothetical protein